ncbi:hypothetical protein FXO37_16880 [Capsicum annuum]|nr:hypothetical protein FXO37_16880 [Capsicum annuum]
MVKTMVRQKFDDLPDRPSHKGQDEAILPLLDDHCDGKTRDEFIGSTTTSVESLQLHGVDILLVAVVGGVGICGFGGGVGGLGVGIDGIGGSVGVLGIIVGIGSIDGGLGGIGGGLSCLSVAIGPHSPFTNEHGIWSSQVQDKFKDYPDEVSHLRILRWLAGKSNKKIKEADLFNPSDDVVHPWIVPTEHKLGMTSFITLGLVGTTADLTVELIKKELAGAKTIRRVVRKDSGAPSGGVTGGVVDNGGNHPVAPATSSHDYEHDNGPQFYNNFKSRYDDLHRKAAPSGWGFDQLFSTFKWDEDIMNYVRGKRPYPHGKSWTKAKRILIVMNVKVKHFITIERLLDEGKIKVYDCNLPVFKETTFYH